MDPATQSKCMSFLREIGYLVPDQGPLAVQTAGVDPEVATGCAPQLVCPADNARYVLNAVNARWGSLFDALYSFDVIPDADGSEKGPKYNPKRGAAVVKWSLALLDEVIPLAGGASWANVTKAWPIQVGQVQQLSLTLEDKSTVSLATPSLFIGSSGNTEKGRVLLQHNGLHIILEIDRNHPVGRESL